jgi:succinate dehydrogenase / fumarate reductase iron-sulfur subunit
VNEDFNQALERAGRVADFFELGELMCTDALHRRESCGGHFRGESQTEEGEALRHDDEFLYVGAWEWGGEGGKPVLHREPLIYEFNRTEATELQVKLKLRIWRQAGPGAAGRMVEYDLDGVSDDMSFLEMLDLLNENLTQGRGAGGVRPRLPRGHLRHVWCRHQRHRPRRPGGVRTTTCQLHMRSFADGATIDIEPWRAGAFPVLKDLVVDRTAFDRIIQAGGFISSTPDRRRTRTPRRPPSGRPTARSTTATCIGCGACVAACPNGSAMLFTAAKITHLAMLPQGQPERYSRVKTMVAQHDAEGFGGCTNIGECAAVCPKGSRWTRSAQLNRDLISVAVQEGRHGLIRP